MMSLEDVLIAAQALPVDDRWRLIDTLWQTTPEAPEQLTEVQQEELDRRLAAHRAAPDQGSSWDAVKARIVGK